MAFVFLQVTRKNEDIINIAGAEVKISQDAVHQELKSGAQISQAEAGVVEGVVTKRFVVLQQIQLAEDSSAVEVGGHISYVNQRVVVGLGEHIKMTVITAGPPGAIVSLD